MKSIAIDPQGNNFIRENGRMRYTKDRLEYIAEKVRHVISVFLGEWFLDPAMGIPYLPGDNTKAMHRTLMETALRTKITAVEGVKRLSYFESTFDPSTRLLSISFIADTDAGELEMKQSMTIGPEVKK